MATVRHAPTGGLNVRDNPAGNKVVTLNAGDLMYDIPGVAAKDAVFNGTNYTWIKVHYYKSGTTTEDGEGWVTKSNTTQISTTAPSKSSTYSSNSVLKQNEMLVNARYIYKYLHDKNWTDNAIYGALGNMEAESAINPGRINSSSKAYGLTQWKPDTKLTDFLEQEGLTGKSDIDNQLRCLADEAANERQWISSKHSPTMKFSDYIASTKSCSTLAEYFLRCYENPSSVSSKVAARQSHAEKWKTLIGYLV